jgi:glycogen synthase kinase 3 beta
MPYFEETIFSLNKKYLINNLSLDPILVKIYSYQLFRGLNYLNSLNIAHRDIKPHNILVDKKNKVVICDFGSAKQLIKGEDNIAYICSRCYRAP